MRAVFTKFLPCTDTKPSRIAAFFPDEPTRDRVTIGCHSRLVTTTATKRIQDPSLRLHRLAAMKFFRRIGWPQGRKAVAGYINSGQWSFIIPTN